MAREAEGNDEIQALGALLDHELLKRMPIAAGLHPRPGLRHAVDGQGRRVVAGPNPDRGAGRSVHAVFIDGPAVAGPALCGRTRGARKPE